MPIFYIIEGGKMFLIVSSLSLALGTPLIVLAVLKNQKLSLRIADLIIGLASIGFFIYINYLTAATASTSFSLALFLIPVLLIIINVLDNYKLIKFEVPTRNKETIAKVRQPVPKVVTVAPPTFQQTVPVMPQPTPAPAVVAPAAPKTVNPVPVAPQIITPSQERTAELTTPVLNKPVTKSEEKFVLPDFF